MQCAYYINRKKRQCSHMVSTLGDSFCALHQTGALEESRVQDQIARERSECRDLLMDVVMAVEHRLHADEADLVLQGRTTSTKRRKKRISAPGRMANPSSLRLTPLVGPINWADLFEDPKLPLYIDVGCARGRTVDRLAQRHERQERNHLGVEIRPDVVRECIDEMQRVRADSPIRRNLHFLAFNFAASAKEVLRSLPNGVLQMISFQVQYTLIIHCICCILSA